MRFWDYKGEESIYLDFFFLSDEALSTSASENEMFKC